MQVGARCGGMSAMTVSGCQLPYGRLQLKRLTSAHLEIKNAREIFILTEGFQAKV